MHRPLQLHEHLLLIAMFGGLFAYFFYGAFSGSLYIPGKRGPGIELTGLAAWLFVVAPPLLYSGILVRHQHLFPLLNDRLRTAVELALLFAGVGIMGLAIRLHWDAFCGL